MHLMECMLVMADNWSPPLLSSPLHHPHPSPRGMPNYYPISVKGFVLDYYVHASLCSEQVIEMYRDGVKCKEKKQDELAIVIL